MQHMRHKGVDLFARWTENGIMWTACDSNQDSTAHKASVLSGRPTHPRVVLRTLSPNMTTKDLRAHVRCWTADTKDMTADGHTNGVIDRDLPLKAMSGAQHFPHKLKLYWPFRGGGQS